MESQYEKYPFRLDEFQTKSVDAIEAGHHVLVCAPTGSGKSMVAQHATDWGLRQNKRVIYTTPIKSLSNQAYASLSKHFGAENIGIMTGDNQYNPMAPVIIMTTEILRNFLVDGRTRKHDSDTDGQYWTMDVGSDVAMVVFDEVHYLQDPHRGYVWETCFIRMPKQVSMVMLSATIANPHTLVEWLERIKERQVVLCEHTKRAVPLHHCLFTHLNPTNKKLPDPVLHRYRNAFVDTTNWSVPELESYLKPVREHYDWFETSATAIRGCVRYLKENDLLPGLCFVLSRKRCETLCATWNVSLLDHDEVSLIAKDWKRIVRDATRGDHELCKKIEGLPQYHLLTESIQKGVAFHHSGVLPILKECVEMLMKDGRIPCMFATETFAVGINSPTRTVVMTQMDKRTEGGVRCLETHEYIQMGGRAGRRGMDSVGYVVNLPISFVKKTSPLMFHRMLHGDPVRISATQLIPSVQVVRALRTQPQALDDLLETLGRKCIRSFEIETSTSESNGTAPLLPTLTEEEQKVWGTWKKLSSKPVSTQGQRKRKQKKLSEWKKTANMTLWESARSKIEEFETLKSYRSEEQERKEEVGQVLATRLAYLEAIECCMRDASSNQWSLTPRGEAACVIQQGNPIHTAFVLTSLGSNLPIGDDTLLEMLQFASLFLGADSGEDVCEPKHRDILGGTLMKRIEQASAAWDSKAQIFSCWEPNGYKYDLLIPLEELKKKDPDSIDFFDIHSLVDTQEGTLWKCMNDLVSMCGEIQEVWGQLGYMRLFKKMEEAITIAKGLTLMIPSLYLQSTTESSGRDLDSARVDNGETGCRIVQSSPDRVPGDFGTVEI